MRQIPKALIFLILVIPGLAVLVGAALEAVLQSSMSMSFAVTIGLIGLFIMSVGIILIVKPHLLVKEVQDRPFEEIYRSPGLMDDHFYNGSIFYIFAGLTFLLYMFNFENCGFLGHFLGLGFTFGFVLIGQTIVENVSIEKVMATPQYLVIIKRNESSVYFSLHEIEEFRLGGRLSVILRNESNKHFNAAIDQKGIEVLSSYVPVKR